MVESLLVEEETIGMLSLLTMLVDGNDDNGDDDDWEDA